MNRLFLLLIAMVYGVPYMHSQHIALKSNLLYDATSTINLGVEVGLTPRLSIDVSGNLNPWMWSKHTNSKIQHILVQPELRYWLCERFKGHFFGAHLHWSNYNVGAVNLPFGITEDTWAKYRYRGNLYGGGIGYGYQWVFRRRWAVEGEIGVGYAFMKYDKYDCKRCGEYLGKQKHHYVGPTKAAISLIYFIK